MILLIGVFLNVIIIIFNLLLTILLLFSFTTSKTKVLFFILMCVHTRERGSSHGFVGV